MIPPTATHTHTHTHKTSMQKAVKYMTDQCVKCKWVIWCQVGLEFADSYRIANTIQVMRIDTINEGKRRRVRTVERDQ